MTAGPLAAAVRHLRRLAPDAELLDQFVAARSETAFAALVQRHGRLVWGVCRRLLANGADAEDAFQATFLVLARKAASARTVASLAGWLHGTACRCAQQIRRQSARRRAHEQKATAMPRTAPQHEASLRELQGILDEEIDRLPPTHRSAFVLCCLEGKTRSEAAQELGWKEGTVAGRLGRARDQLRARLERRGVTLSAALAAAALVEQPAAAGLLDRAVSAACGLAVAPHVVAVADRVARAAPLSAARFAAVVLLALTVAGAGAISLPTQATPPQKIEDRGSRIEDGRSRVENRNSPDRPSILDPRSSILDLHGDPLPKGALMRLGTTRLRHRGIASAVAFSPDGKFLVSGGADDFIRFWDPATAREVRRLPQTRYHTMALAFSPDGKLLASGNGGFTTSIWDLATGKELHHLEGHKGHARFVAFSPDGKTLYTGGGDGGSGDGTLRAWDVATGKTIWSVQAQERWVQGGSLSRDGKLIATAGNEDAVYIRDAATGKETHRLWKLHHGAARVAFSADGNTLFTGSQEGICTWDVKTGEGPKRLVPRPFGGDYLVVSPDGKSIAGGDRGAAVSVWDADTGKLLRKLEGHRCSVFAFAFAPDGKSFATGGSDHTVRLWDAQTSKEIHRFDAPQGEVFRAAFAPDGKTVFSASRDHLLRVWDAATGKQVRQFGHPDAVTRLNLVGATFAPDGRLAATGDQDGTVNVWEVATGKRLHGWREHNWPSRSLAFTPDGKKLFADVSGLHFCSWDLTTGKPYGKAPGIGRETIRLEYSGDARIAAGAQYDSSVLVWEVPEGTKLHRLVGHRSQPFALALSDDGRLLATASANHLALWEVVTGKPICSAEWRGPPIEAQCAAISPDGRTVALGTHQHQVLLYETATAQLRQRLEGHQGPVMAVAFSRDGRRLVSGSSDTTLLLWDVTGAEAARKPDAKELERLWADLRSDDAMRAYRAVWALASSSREALPYLQDRLPTKATQPPEAMTVGKLIKDLDSAQFRVREEASRRLAAMGREALAPLRQALERPLSLEARRRIEALMPKLQGPPLSPWEGERLRLLRAVEVLEKANRPEARELLDTLTRSLPDVELQEQARAALRRLSGKSTPER